MTDYKASKRIVGTNAERVATVEGTVTQNQSSASVTVFTAGGNESDYGLYVANTSSALYGKTVSSIKMKLSRNGSSGSDNVKVRLHRGSSYVHTFGETAPSSIAASATDYIFGTGGFNTNQTASSVELQSGDRIVFSWDRTNGGGNSDYMNVFYKGDSSSNVFDSGNTPATMSANSGSSWTNYNTGSGTNARRDLYFEVVTVVTPNIQENSTWEESDTGKHYLWDGTDTWIEIV